MRTSRGCGRRRATHSRDDNENEDDDEDDDDRLISGVEDPCSRPRGVPGGQEEGHLCWTRQGGICQVRFISDLFRCISSAYQVYYVFH